MTSIMVRRAGSVALLVVVALTGSASPAPALCAIMGRDLCNRFWSYDAVFDGTVVAIDQSRPDPDEPTLYQTPYRLVTFQVHTSWRGDAGAQIQLRMPGGPTDDGLYMWVGESVEFERGRRYLVFASLVGMKTKYLTTTSCAPTAAVPSKSADESFAFLHTLARPSKGARVFGGLFDQGTFRAGERFDPSIVARVTLERDGFRRSLTSIGGVYSFEGIQPGSYALTVSAPGFTGEMTRHVRIPALHACAERNFHLRR
jgi:hypothetical protein